MRSPVRFAQGTFFSTDKGFKSKLNIAPLIEFLRGLPMEYSNIQKSFPVINLLMPDGSFSRFRIWETELMEKELARRFPDRKDK